MDVELIKALATLSGAGVDVKTLIGQNQEEVKEETKNENTISFEDVLKMVQEKNKPEPEPEPKPASNNVSFDDVLKLIKATQKPAEKPEEKTEPASGLSDDQFGKLLQAMNVKNVAIDVPNDDDWKKRMESHFSELINGTNNEKEEK